MMTITEDQMQQDLDHYINGTTCLRDVPSDVVTPKNAGEFMLFLIAQNKDKE